MGDNDIDAMAALLGDPQIMRFYPSPKGREEAAQWIEWNQRNYADQGYGLWIIETHEGDFVGDCGLTWQSVGEVRMLEVGYHVRTAWQRRGLASEAAAACRDLARANIETDELAAIVHPENRASLRVAEKIGMLPRAAQDGSRTVMSMRLR